MKKWIRFIFKNNKNLERLCIKLDSKIEETALSMCERSNKLADKLISLNKKKAVLINMRVIHNKIMEALTNDERDCVCDFLEDKQLPSEGFCSVGLQKIYSKAEKVLSDLGYNNKKLAEDYSLAF